MSVKTNSATILYDGRVFKLYRENVTLSNRVTVDLDIIHHPGASAMIPMSGNDNVILIDGNIIYNSVLSGYEINTGTNYIKLIFGMVRLDLTDKLRRL